MKSVEVHGKVRRLPSGYAADITSPTHPVGIKGCPMGRGSTPQAAIEDLQRRVREESGVEPVGFFEVEEEEEETGAPYRWVITRDRYADKDAPEGTCANAKGLWGPGDASEGVTHNEAPFSMYDDDGNCCYEGVVYGDYSGFEPLDDFGTGNAGCVAIMVNGEWLLYPSIMPKAYAVE